MIELLKECRGYIAVSGALSIRSDLVARIDQAIAQLEIALVTIADEAEAARKAKT